MGNKKNIVRIMRKKHYCENDKNILKKNNNEITKKVMIHNKKSNNETIKIIII